MSSSFLSPHSNTFRWLQLYMATTLLVVDLGLVAIVANQGDDLRNLEGLATWSVFFSEYSIVMTCAGFGSYLLLLFHLFLLPRCPTIADLLIIYNMP